MASIGLYEAFIGFLCFLISFYFLVKKPFRYLLIKKTHQSYPWNWPVLGMLPGILLRLQRIYDYSVEFLENSNMTFQFKGPWFVGMDILATADPTNIHYIMSSNFSNYIKGPIFHEIFEAFGDGIINTDAELWRDWRNASQLIFNHQRHITPRFVWKLQKWIGIGTEKKMSKANATLDRVCEKLIAAKREELRSQGIIDNANGDSEDLLTSHIMLDATKYELLNPNDDKFLRDFTVSFMAAGRDSTSSALTWFFWNLTENPNVLSKILQEINTNLPRTGSDQDMSSYLNKLVYLHGALNESMRLYPPIPFERKSPIKDDVLPSGHKVKSNLNIMIFIYAMGRMKTIWGEDAMEFKPERWISETGGLRHEPSYKFWVET